MLDVLKVRYIKQIVSDPEYARNCAIEYGEQYGAWIAEYHMWNGVDCKRAKIASENADKYFKRMRSCARTASIFNFSDNYPEELDYES